MPEIEVSRADVEQFMSRFLVRVKEALEDPLRFLLEV